MEAAKHEGDAWILAEMGAGFVATACQVKVSNRRLVEDAEAVNPFGGKVDAAIDSGGGSEEEVLGLNEGLEFGREVGIEFRHDA